MSAPEQDSNLAAQGKKRKRTGKEREERKRAAILQAQKDEEDAKKAEEAAASGPSAVTVSEETAEPAVAETGAAEPPRSVIDLEKVASRIPQALKSLHPAFKQAKTFETRRLIKKIKFLRSKSGSKEEMEDLEAQLKIIHDLQLHPLAQSHLLLKLRKHHQLKHSTLPTSITSPLTPETPAASTSAAPALAMKAENRLCSAKSVAERVKSVVAWVVGEEGAKLVAPVKATGAKAVQSKARRAASDDEDDDEDADADSEDAEVDERFARQVVVNASDAESDSDDERAREEDRAADAVGWESGSIGGSEDGSDDESEGESDDSDAIPVPSAKRSKPTPAPAAKAQPKTLKEKPGKASKADLASSIFLPSLSAGFTRGNDSDSDPDLDFDPNGVAGSKVPERKNRRGQRARQAIWEKKYGKNAKHVVKQREEDEKAPKKVAGKMMSRDAGWGAKAGDAPAPRAGAGAGGASGGRGGYAGRPAAPHQPVAAPAPASGDKAKALHPSWEAARLRKEKMSAVQAAKPNKIVFD
ncbi:hypothetical protein IAT38_005727 [Cryptococcus sp. DSM 104549]